jgi:hypothetical protein
MESRHFCGWRILEVALTFRVLVLVVFCTAVGACQVQTTDSEELYDTVATLVTESTPRTAGKVVVLDAENLRRLPPPLVDRLRERALRVYDRVLVSDVGQDVRNLPGDWLDNSSSTVLRRNTTHLLLLVELGGNGSRRSLKWDFLCGEVCGWGKSVTLLWDGRDWSVTIESDHVH